MVLAAGLALWWGWAAPPVGAQTHTAPSFASTTAARDIPEDASTGDGLRDPSTSAVAAVTATDADGDSLTYSVAATADTAAARADLAAFNRDFSLDASSGLVAVRSGAMIAYATRTSYVVKLEVTDGEDSSGAAESPAVVDDSLTLTVTVLDVADHILSVAAPSGGTFLEGGRVPVTVTLTPTASAAVTVGWATSVGTDAGTRWAISGTDFTADSATLSFAAGETSKTVTVATTQDRLDEWNEQFLVVLSSPTGGAGFAGAATTAAAAVPIWDDDHPQVTISAGDNELEGDPTVVTATIDIMSSRDLTVEWRTEVLGAATDVPGRAGSSCSAGVDYVAVPLSSLAKAVIPAGSTSAALSVTTCEDAVAETDETLAVGFVFLKDPDGASIPQSSPPGDAIVRILDDEPRVVVAAAAVSVSEGVSGGKVQVTVNLVDDDGTAVSAVSAVTVRWSTGVDSDTATVNATGGGSTSSSRDFTSVSSGVLTIAANRSSAVAEVVLNDDRLDEWDEVFTVSLVSASGAHVGDTAGDEKVTAVTVTDDDTPVVTVAAVSVIEGSTATVTATMDIRSSRALTLAVYNSNRSATGEASCLTAGADYLDFEFIFSSDRLMIAAGAVSASVTVTTCQDSDVEPDETFEVIAEDLFDPDGNSLGARGARGTVTILDDEPRVVVAGPSVRLVESTGGVAGVVSVGVRLVGRGGSSATLPADVTVGWSTGTDSDADTVDATGGTASDTTRDYTSVSSGTLTIAAGQSAGTVMVSLNDDRLDEWDEVFTVVLDSVSASAHLGDPDDAKKHTAVTIFDNDDPQVTLSAGDNELEGDPTVVTATIDIMSSRDLTVQWVTGTLSGPDWAREGSSCGAGVDYVTVPRSSPAEAVISAGSTSTTLSLPTCEDAIAERDENLNIFVDALTDPDGLAQFQAISTNLGIVRILDDEPRAVVAAGVSVAEDVSGGKASVGVNLVDRDGDSVNAAAAVTVGWSTGGDGDAMLVDATGGAASVSGRDFTSVASGSLTIPVGASSGTVEVSLNDDSLDEWDEGFSVVLSSVSSNAHLGTLLDTGKSTKVTIVDDDPLPSVSIDDAAVVEGSGGLRFTVRLGAVSGRDVKVQHETRIPTSVQSGSHPVKAADFTAIDDGEVVVRAGQSTATVSVPVVNDSLDEYDEYVLLYVTSVLDDPDADPADRVALGTAVASDHVDTGTDATGPRGVITDNDDPPFVTIDNAMVTEGAVDADNDALGLDFTVRLAAVSGRDVKVQYTTQIPTSTVSGLRPVKAADFTAATGEATIAEGGRTAVVTVAVTDDMLDEYREYVLLYITGAVDAAGTELAQVLAKAHVDTGTDGRGPRGVIVDDDDPPTVSVAAASAAEGDDVSFTVSLDAVSGRDVDVNWRTRLHTAVPAPPAAAQQADFTAVSTAKATVAEGDTSVVVVVSTVEDRVDEYDQTFVVELTSTPGTGENKLGTISATAGSAVGTIVDDDPVPRLALGSVAVAEDVASGTAALTVSLVHAVDGDPVTSEKPLSVDYSTSEASDAAVDAVWPPPVPDPDPAATARVRRERKAIAAADYTAAAVSAAPKVSIAAGASSGSFTVAIVDDDLDEHDELFTVVLASPTNATVHPSRGSAGVQINDDDPLPALVVTVAAVGESDTDAAVVFTVGLDAASGRTVTVDYQTGDLTQARLAAVTGLSCADEDSWTCVQARDHLAVAGADYTAVDSDLSFGPLADGATPTTATISVAVADDSLDEHDELFALVLSPDFAMTPALSSVGVISDDDDPPTLFIPNSPRARHADLVWVPVSGVAIESEGTLVLNGELSAVSGRSTSVALRTLTGSRAYAANPTWDTRAQPGSDVTAVNGRWIIPKNTTRAGFDFEVHDDAVAESLFEFFVAELSDAQHIALLDKDRMPASRLQVLLEARDDDRDQILRTQSVTVDESAGTATVYVGLASDITEQRAAIDVTCATVDQTATAGNDYTAHTGTELTLSTPDVTPADAAKPLSEQAADTRLAVRAKAVTVTIASDTASEADETLAVACTADLEPPRSVSAVITIQDTSTEPQLTLTPRAVTLRESANTATLTATLDKPHGKAVTATIATTDGTAAAGSDYRRPTGTNARLRIAPGQTTATFEIVLTDDERVETDETFTVALTDPQNATLNTTANNTTITITDNEDDPALAITSSSAAETADNITFTVTLTPPTGDTVTVEYNTTDNSATAPDDYTTTNGTLTFNPGETTQTINVPLNDDDQPEGNHTFTITLTNPTNARISLTRGTATGTIRDNEQPTTSFTGGGAGGGANAGSADTETPTAGPAGFADVDPDNIHAPNIDALAAAAITTGCATQPLRYCPQQPVTRAQMATFLTRALNLPTAEPAGFTDVDPDNVHTPAINALAAAGITTGCNTNPLQYCPQQPVTRAQMATFLTRALNLEPAPTANFTDVDPDNVHTPAINALAAAGITTGCNTDPLQYCPQQPVTRAQMATFLTRALNL